MFKHASKECCDLFRSLPRIRTKNCPNCVPNQSILLITELPFGVTFSFQINIFRFIIILQSCFEQ